MQKEHAKGYSFTFIKQSHFVPFTKRPSNGNLHFPPFSGFSQPLQRPFLLSWVEERFVSVVPILPSSLLTWKLYWETNEGMSIKLDSNFRMTNILLSIFHLGFLRRKISCCGAPTTTARASKASSSYWYVHRKSPSELFCSRENQSNARHHQHSGHQQQQQWKFWPESCVCVCARTYRTLSHWVNTECVLQY